MKSLFMQAIILTGIGTIQRTVLPGISPELKRRIFVENACELYAHRLQMTETVVERAA